MATHFFGSNFFGGEFFFAAETAPFVGGGHFTPARYYTPLPPEKERIDKALEEELRVRVAIHKELDSGTDTRILDDLQKRLTEIQKLILMLALESQIAYDYIQLKRQEEDEEISVILSLI